MNALCLNNCRFSLKGYCEESKMNFNDISKECINNPEMNKILASALRAELASAEKSLADAEQELVQSKKEFFVSFESRKKSKQELKYIQDQNVILQSTLNQLNCVINEQNKKKNLLKEKLDDASLNANFHTAQQHENLKKIQEEWTAYEAEFEKLPLAITRKRVVNELEQRKVQLLLTEYKNAEQSKKRKCMESICRKQIHAKGVEFAKIVKMIWEAQDRTDKLMTEAKNLDEELQFLTQQYENRKKEKEDKAIAQALARQQMPPPRLDMSFIESLYGRPIEVSTPERVPRKRVIDPDTVSIDTVMLDEICSQEHYTPSDELSSSDLQEEKSSESSSLYEHQIQSDTTDEQKNDKIPKKSNVETLEKVCKQLSIHEDDNCNDFDNLSENEDVNLKMSQESQLERQPSFARMSNQLKKKSSSFDGPTEDIESQPPDNKRSKLEEPITDLSKQNLKEGSPKKTSKELPQVTSIETIHRSIKLQRPMQPSMIDTPSAPPSSLFSKRHYAPSFASSDNLSHVYDNMLNDEQLGKPDFAGATPNPNDFTLNWQTLSPQISMSSLASACPSTKIAFAPVDNIVESQPAAQTNNTGSNFLSFFSSARPERKGFF